MHQILFNIILTVHAVVSSIFIFHLLDTNNNLFSQKIQLQQEVVALKEQLAVMNTNQEILVSTASSNNVYAYMFVFTIFAFCILAVLRDISGPSIGPLLQSYVTESAVSQVQSTSELINNLSQNTTQQVCDLANQATRIENLLTVMHLDNQKISNIGSGSAMSNVTLQNPITSEQIASSILELNNALQNLI